jgi:hypothetical protein
MVDLSFQQNLPLYLFLLLIFSYIFWAKFFSNAQKVSPKKANDLISIALIFLFLFFSLFSTFYLCIYPLQNYVYAVNFELMIKIISILIIISIAVLLVIIATYPKKKVRDILFSIKLIPLSSLIGFFLIFSSTFSFFNNHTYGSIFLQLIPTVILFVIISLVSNILIYTILILSNNGTAKEEWKDTNKIMSFKIQKKYLSIFVAMLILFIIISVFYIIQNFSFAKEKSTTSLGYSIQGFYDGSANRDILQEYSYTLFGSPKKIVLKFDNNTFDLNNRLELSLKENRSIYSIWVSQNNQGYNTYGINDVRIDSAGYLFVYFDQSFIRKKFDSFVLTGSHKEDISDRYNITLTNTRYSFNEHSNKIIIKFEINNLLNERMTHIENILLPSWINKDNFANCSFNNTNSNVRLNGIVTGIYKTCQNDRCSFDSFHLSIYLINDVDRIYFQTNADNRTGKLEIDATLDCN